MPGQKPCEAGCTCGHHTRQRVSPEERRKRRRAQNRIYYERNLEESRQRARDAYWADPEKSRAKLRARKRVTGTAENLRAVHGMEVADKAAMREAQAGRCCYCNRPLPDDERKVHIDHDHSCTCGPTRSCQYCRRGLACENCNRLVGMADDDPDRLELIAANLRRLDAAARERISGKPIQEELPLNVRRLERREGSG
jgi:Recombination endonuclease VII